MLFSERNQREAVGLAQLVERLAGRHVDAANGHIAPNRSVDEDVGAGLLGDDLDSDHGCRHL